MKIILRKIFNKIFHDVKSNKSTYISSIVQLQNISNPMGEYGSLGMNPEIEHKDKYFKGKEMLSKIIAIEKKTKHSKDANLFYELAIAYRNYCAFFVRGDKRRKYLETTILFLNYSSLLSPENNEAKAELGRILISERLVRDLKRGIDILDILNKNDDMPYPLESILAKAKRQYFGVKIELLTNLCNFNKHPSPAVFREERIKYRTLIRKYKKDKNIEKLKIVLNRYYQFSVLVTLCYGRHHCDSGLIDFNFNKLEDIVNNYCRLIDYTYVKNGKIINSCFISENDWKTFIKIFGENSRVFNPRKDIEGDWL